MELVFERDGHSVSAVSMSSNELRWQIVAAGKVVLEFCDRVGARSDDIDNLRLRLATLDEH